MSETKRQQHFNNKKVRKPKATKKTTMSDIKYDLLKIIEPYNGVITSSDDDAHQKKLRKLFNAYLEDRKTSKTIYEFSIDPVVNETSITYEMAISLEQNRRPKKLKIHVGLFSHPWINKKEENAETT